MNTAAPVTRPMFRAALAVLDGAGAEPEPDGVEPEPEVVDPDPEGVDPEPEDLEPADGLAAPDAAGAVFEAEAPPEAEALPEPAHSC